MAYSLGKLNGYALLRGWGRGNQADQAEVSPAGRSATLCCPMASRKTHQLDVKAQVLMVARWQGATWAIQKFASSSHHIGVSEKIGCSQNLPTVML